MNNKMAINTYLSTIESSPGWCGSVGWVLACKLKGLWFDSWSGHMPGSWARYPVEGHKRQPIDVSLEHRCSFPFSLPSPLSLKKIINYFFKKPIESKKQTKQTRTETESWIWRVFSWLPDGRGMEEWVEELRSTNR